MKKLLLLLLIAFPGLAQNTVTTNLSSAAGGCITTGATPNCVSVGITGQTTTASVTLSGSFSGTLQFESSGDGVTFAAQAMNPTGGGAAVSSATATGVWTACVASLTQMRVRVSAYTSGPVSATVNTSTASVASCSTGIGSYVSSFNSRTGAVSPASNDYSCGQLSNAATSCSTDATNASNIASGTLNASRLPATATITIASGTSALGTSAISSGACATVVTTAATGTATTDNIEADFNADPTSTTGYAASSGGMLTIIKYPTSGNVNFKVCNNTASSITPGAVTLNWRVVR